MTEKKRKDKEIILELEAQTKEVRHQLSEQLRCFDQRLESHHCMTWELSEFYQHRAVIEQEYSRSLERLVKQIKLRHKSEKQKRENWSSYSTYQMWQNVLDSTVSMSKNHAVLSDTYSSISIKGFAQIMDDLQRINGKCKEIAISLHKEVTKVLDELQNSMKTYHLYHGQSRQSATKLQRAETQKSRVEQDAKKGGNTLSKRYLSYEKQTEKQKAKLEASNQKVMRARNDYLLSIETANGCIHKYFMDDLPELMDAMDYGYHLSMKQVMNVNVQLERNICKRQLDRLGGIERDALNLNQGLDRQAFIQTSHQTFSLPKKFKFQQHKGDSVSDIVAQRPVRTELNERFKVILERIRELKLQNEELWKTLETADGSMLEKRTLKDFDADSMFVEDRTLGKNSSDLDKMRTEQIETLMFYISKYKEFLLNSNMIARLQARSKAIEKGLVSSNVHVTRPMPVSLKLTKKKPLGKGVSEGRPKLFGGSIVEYVQATGQEIPVAVRCCINIINLHGMHQQGLFRVPGSQHEINEFKQIFERGEEVILKRVEARNINSIAGVLKLYFRELREPLFPLQLFHELISCIPSDVNDLDPETLQKSVSRLQELLLPLQRPVVLLMRYLFAFLNHVTEHSDENLMDARNLAICFGPTLLPMPPERAQLQGKVNDLVQMLVLHHDKIFPNDGGVIYEKCMADNCEFEESLDCALEGATDVRGEESDEEPRNIDAVALYDFESRTEQELSFKKGDLLVLKRRISEDWWEGVHGDQMGLVPIKYVATGAKRSGERLRTSSESLPNKSSEVATDRHPPATEGLDRSKSESNICDDLGSGSVAVGRSGSSTTSDLSRNDGSLATWSGKSSSSKEILDEPVLLTDSEAASPVECCASLDLRCDRQLSFDAAKESSCNVSGQDVLSCVSLETCQGAVQSSTDCCLLGDSEDLTLKRKKNSSEHSSDEISLDLTVKNLCFVEPVLVAAEIGDSKASLSEADCVISNEDVDSGTLIRNKSNPNSPCASLLCSEAATNDDAMQHQDTSTVSTEQPVHSVDDDILFLASVADFDKAVSSFGDKAAAHMMDDVLHTISGSELSISSSVQSAGDVTADSESVKGISADDAKISCVGHSASRLSGPIAEERESFLHPSFEKSSSSESSLLPPLDHPSSLLLPADSDDLPPPPEFCTFEGFGTASDGSPKQELDSGTLTTECKTACSLTESLILVTSFEERSVPDAAPLQSTTCESRSINQESPPVLDVLSTLSDADISAEITPEAVLDNKLKPKPPPVMKKPSKPN